MTSETLTYAESGDVATVTLNRPLINMAMVRELTRACDRLEDDSRCKAVVFRGADGVFSRGIDFKEFHPRDGMDIHGFNKWEKLCVRIERLPKATIAALDGVAVGGGVQLALVCDSRVATSRTTLQLNEVHLGFLPGMATFRLAKYVGLGRAKRLVMQCPTVGADEAQQMGLVDKVGGDLDSLIAEAVSSFGPINTVAVELARRLLNESYAVEFEDAIGNFLAAQHRAISQNAFLETIKKASED